MAESGIAYVSGRGQGAVYGLTSEADRKRASAADHSSASADMAWYLVASGAASTREDVARELRCEPAEIEATIDSLVADGSLREENGQLVSRRFEITVGAEKGWETAVCDHFRAMAAAIAAKVGRPSSEQDDRTGGGTVSFILPPGHPHAADAHRLLETVREQVNALWRRASDYNQAHPPPEGSDRLTFYFGQHLIPGGDSAGAASDGADVTTSVHHPMEQP